MSNTFDIPELTQGNTIKLKFTFEEADSSEPYSVSGWTVKMHVKRTVNDFLPLIDVTPYCTFATDGDDGVIRVQIPPSATKNITPTPDERDGGTIALIYDLDITSPTGKVYTVFAGSFDLTREVTK